LSSSSEPARRGAPEAGGRHPLEKKGGEVINSEEKTKKSGKYKGFRSPPSRRDIAQKKINDLNAATSITQCGSSR
jgi:hypothetical protein